MLVRKSQIIFTSCLGFIIGIAIASFFTVSWLVIYGGIIIGLFIFIVSSQRTWLRAIAWLIVFIVLGIIRYQLSIPLVNPNYISFYNGQRVSFKGVVDNEVAVDEASQKLEVRSNKLDVNNKSDQIHGQVLVKTGLFPEYQYGDQLDITCQLQAPEPIEGFRYDKYLAKSGIYSICYQPQIKIINRHQGNLIKTNIYKLKSYFSQITKLILPEPESSFLRGLLWGEKTSLPEEVMTDFNRAGITHVIAVSGYNISIIVKYLISLFLLIGLTKKRAFLLIILSIGFFVIITGAPGSILRAAVMGAVIILAENLGRPVIKQNILALTAVGLLLINPMILIWDAGFQLSFLATIGIIYWSDYLKKLFKFLPSKFQIQETLSATMSAILLTSPLIVYQFGRFSVIAPVVNLLVLPIIPINMGLGFLATIVGLIYLPLGQIIGWFSWFGLTYVIKITHWLANLSFSSLSISGLPVHVLIAYYIIIIFYTIKNSRHEKVIN